MSKVIRGSRRRGTIELRHTRGDDTPRGMEGIGETDPVRHISVLHVLWMYETILVR